MWTETLLSKFILGTAQLGQDYGVTNKFGKPNFFESIRILEEAWKHGIRSFDTAPSYNTEQLLGEFVCAHGVSNEIKLITKVPGGGRQSLDVNNVCRSLESSINRLNGVPEVVFFHDPGAGKVLDVISNVIEKVQVQFSIERVGISIYQKTDLISGLDFEELIYLFPYNYLDVTFHGNDLRTGTRYGRSLFLQGVLAGGGWFRHGTPFYLSRIHDYLKKCFEDKPISMLEYAFLFGIQSIDIDKFMLGVCSVSELHQLMSIDPQTPKPYIDVDGIREFVRNHDIDPRVWS